MARTKKSSVTQVRVVEYDPRRVAKRRILILLGVLVLMAGSGYFGWKHGGDDGQVRADQHAALSKQLSEREQQLADLERKLVILERGSKVERMANENVRQEVTALNEKIYQLQKKITFYKSIMAPASGGRQLKIHDLELTAGVKTGHVRYKIVLTQITNRRDVIKGTVAFTVIGSQAGTRVELTSKQLGIGSGDGRWGHRFSFRYFEELEGEMRLPEGFEPEMLRVAARSTGKKPAVAEREIPWFSKEEKPDVRQG